MADEKVNLFNPHDGLTGRDGGPYLDQVERNNAEIVRAAKEGRKPDLENAPATAGTPLVTASELVKMANPASVPSQAGTTDAMTNAVDTLAANEDFPVSAFAAREKTDAEKEAARLAESNDPFDNPASPVWVSKDENASKEAAASEKANPAKKSPAKKTAAKTAAKKAPAAKTASPVK